MERFAPSYFVKVSYKIESKWSSICCSWVCITQTSVSLYCRLIVDDVYWFSHSLFFFSLSRCKCDWHAVSRGWLLITFKVYFHANSRRESSDFLQLVHVVHYSLLVACFNQLWNRPKQSTTDDDRYLTMAGLEGIFCVQIFQNHIELFPLTKLECYLTRNFNPTLLIS